MVVAALVVAIVSVLVSGGALVFARRAEKRADAAERHVGRVTTLEEMRELVKEIGMAVGDRRLGNRLRAQLREMLAGWPEEFPAVQAVADDDPTLWHKDAIAELQRAIAREHAERYRE